MQFTYWTSFKKKKGSTAKPTGGTSKTCYLKEDTSMIRPTIKLSGWGYNNITYGYIADFSRYYFIRDIRKVGPDTEIDLVSDPMASFKSDITGHFQYVERAASGPLLIKPDPLNPPREESETVTTSIGSLATLMNITTVGIVEYYILTVASTKGIMVFGLDYTAMVQLYAVLFDSNVITQVENDFFNVSDCIVSMKKSPFIPVGNPGQPIYMGDHNTGITGTELNSYPIQNVMATPVALGFPSVNIGGLTGKNYLDFAPYSSGFINLPFVGLVPLDLDIFGDEREIGVDYYIDQRTTDIVYRIKTTGGKIVATYAGTAGADVALAAQNGNPLGALTGIVQTIGGVAAVSHGDMLGISHIASGIAQTAGSIERHTQINGGMSSMVGAYLSQDIFAEVRTRKPITWDLEDMRATNGILIDRSIALNDLSGFVKCIDAKVYTSATDEERAEIENYMNTGFFIE